MPERSSIEPMNTNSGTAANTKFDERSSIFSMNWKTTRSPNTARPNSTAVIIMQNATGKPRNISVKATGSIRNGRYSTIARHSPRTRANHQRTNVFHDFGHDLQREQQKRREEDHAQRPDRHVKRRLAAFLVR